MQVGPRTPVETQMQKAEVGPTSGPNFRADAHGVSLTCCMSVVVGPGMGSEFAASSVVVAPKFSRPRRRSQYHVPLYIFYR
jgi:hypothetical protein